MTGLPVGRTVASPRRQRTTGPRVWTTRSPNTSVGADAEADCPSAQVRSSLRCSEGKRCGQKQGEPPAEEVMRQRRCGGCERLFYVCSSCDRGHRYCSARCQAQHRTQSLRAARQRHQLSPEGRLDHRDRQRTYRARQQQRRMTDHTSLRAGGRKKKRLRRRSSIGRPRENVEHSWRKAL